MVTDLAARHSTLWRYNLFLDHTLSVLTCVERFVRDWVRAVSLDKCKLDTILIKQQVHCWYSPISIPTDRELQKQRSTLTCLYSGNASWTILSTWKLGIKWNNRRLLFRSTQQCGSCHFAGSSIGNIDDDYSTQLYSWCSVSFAGRQNDLVFGGFVVNAHGITCAHDAIFTSHGQNLPTTASFLTGVQRKLFCCGKFFTRTKNHKSSNFFVHQKNKGWSWSCKNTYRFDKVRCGEKSRVVCCNLAGERCELGALGGQWESSQITVGGTQSWSAK